MRQLAIVIVGLAAMSFAPLGCGDDDGAPPAAETTTNEPEAAETEQAEAEEPESDCERAPRALVDQISVGLTVTGGGTLRAVRAVRSSDFERAYFVSAEIQGDGLEGDDEIATWATNRLDGTGLVYAVDGVASEFSDWGEGGQTDAGFSLSDDGADESRACVEDAL